MKKRNTAIEGLLIIMMIVPLLYLLAIYGNLPDTVPTHFDSQGNPNGWSEKFTLFYMVGGLQLLVYVTMKYAPSIDPKKNFDRFDALYSKLRVIMQVFIMLIAIVLVYSTNGTGVDIKPGLTASLGVFMVMVGNYMQNVKPNYFIGVRTPWSLESESNWRKTNRFVGRGWFIGGFVLIISVFITPANWFAWSAIVLFGGISVAGIIYSYLIFKNEKKVKLKP